MELSLSRALKVAAWTALFAGPVTVWWRVLDTRFPTPAAGAATLAARLKSVLYKVSLNQAIAAPVNNGGFYAWVVGVRIGATFVSFSFAALCLSAFLPRCLAASLPLSGSLSRSRPRPMHPPARAEGCCVGCCDTPST